MIPRTFCLPLHLTFSVTRDANSSQYVAANAFTNYRAYIHTTFIHTFIACLIYIRSKMEKAVCSISAYHKQRYAFTLLLRSLTCYVHKVDWCGIIRSLSHHSKGATLCMPQCIMGIEIWHHKRSLSQVYTIYRIYVYTLHTEPWDDHILWLLKCHIFHPFLAGLLMDGMMGSTFEGNDVKKWTPTQSHIGHHLLFITRRLYIHLSFYLYNLLSSPFKVVFTLFTEERSVTQYSKCWRQAAN